MDAFEGVVASILQKRGFWTQTSVKVELTKPEKRAIGRHSSPRWEIDVVGYRGNGNELAVVECKSFLDSMGVRCDVFEGTFPQGEGRYKLLCDPELRKVVVGRLVKQFVQAGLCAPKPKVSLYLAAGKVYRGQDTKLESLLAQRGWKLWGPSYIRNELATLRDSGYENSVASVVAKLLLRGETGPPNGAPKPAV